MIWKDPGVLNAVPIAEKAKEQTDLPQGTLKRLRNWHKQHLLKVRMMVRQNER